ncbi:MAG TPA: tetratricopeptide repeat protein [Verrucomicrobiae bacterium]|jgi:tetratricopeptide (TPR) repeat protein|nr:tetratricopeptide repeat protein [Verrucomicrobiae bacterium]
MRRSWAAALLGVVGLCASAAFAADTALVRDPDWELGRKYLAEGKSQEAQELLSRVAQKYPREPDPHLFVALAALRTRDAQRAAAEVEKTLSLDPDHVEARTLRGWIELEVKRDYAAAAADYAKVVELKPDLAEAHNNLGVAYKKAGELDKAAASFNHAVELRPGYSEARSNLGWVYAEEKKWREARKEFEQALKSNPNDEGALYGLAEAQREMRDYSAAEGTLKRLIARAPNFVYWLEWGQVKLVHYYWVLLVAALLLYLNSRYLRTRRELDGGPDGKKA